jgi:hypothetical protein
MSPPPNSPPIHVVLRLSGASTTIEGVVHDETGNRFDGGRDLHA